MNSPAMDWADVVAMFSGYAKGRAPGLPSSSLTWAELVNSYNFIPVLRDGQWTTFGVVPKGSDTGYIQLSGGERVLHAPMVQVNIGNDGNPQFFTVVPDVFARGAHQYNFGQPMYFPEPLLGVPVPAKMRYLRDDQTECPLGSFITGVIVKDKPGPNGKIVKRTNLTVLAEKLNADGSIEIDGETYHLYGLFHKDANRFAPNRFDAFFSPVRPPFVTVRELAQAM